MKVERLSIFRANGKHAGSDARTMTLDQAIAEILPAEQDIARRALVAGNTYPFTRDLTGMTASGRIVPQFAWPTAPGGEE